MNVKKLAACLLAAAAMPVAAGCSASTGAMHPAASSPTNASSAAMSPTTVPDVKRSGSATPGAVMSSTAPAHTAVSAAGPSPAAKMICTDETRDNITTVLSMAPDPHPVSSWRNSTYTCTYRLPAGRIVLTVHEAANDQAATGYTTAQRSTVSGEKDLTGLNPGAFGTADGVVVLQKDNDTMRVDTSGLSPHSRLYARRAGYAYNIAAVVLGCWNGN